MRRSCFGRDAFYRVPNILPQAHIDVTAESVAEVHDRRKQARVLKMIYESKYLRFFQARFKRK